VRNSDAHAWTEVWLAGQGWVRVDPTVWVAPERLSAGLDGRSGQIAQLLPLCACLAIGPAIGADAASNADQHAPPGLISEGLARFAPYLYLNPVRLSSI